MFLDQIATSSKTRIKTLYNVVAYISHVKYQIATSSKTRIKTFSMLNGKITTGNQIATSSKTRIKTSAMSWSMWLSNCIRLQHPVKQGLRLY